MYCLACPQHGRQCNCAFLNKGTSCQINFLLNRLITVPSVPHYIPQTIEKKTNRTKQTKEKHQQPKPKTNKQKTTHKNPQKIKRGDKVNQLLS